MIVCSFCSWFFSCAVDAAERMPQSKVCPTVYAPANVHVVVAENGRAEGAKAKGEGEGKARTAMGGAERLDAVRLFTVAKTKCHYFWPAPGIACPPEGLLVGRAAGLSIMRSHGGLLVGRAAGRAARTTHNMLLVTRARASVQG